MTKNCMRFFLIIGIIFAGCVKDKNMITSSGIESVKNDTLNSVALVIWTGAYEVDGCGFFIKINNREYKAVNEEIIGNEFRSFFDSSYAQLKYINLGTKIYYLCGDFPFVQKIEGIEIIEIEKLNIIKMSP